MEGLQWLLGYHWGHRRLPLRRAKGVMRRSHKIRGCCWGSRDWHHHPSCWFGCWYQGEVKGGLYPFSWPAEPAHTLQCPIVGIGGGGGGLVDFPSWLQTLRWGVPCKSASEGGGGGGCASSGHSSGFHSSHPAMGSSSVSSSVGSSCRLGCTDTWPKTRRGRGCAVPHLPNGLPWNHLVFRYGTVREATLLSPQAVPLCTKWPPTDPCVGWAPWHCPSCGAAIAAPTPKPLPQSISSPGK